MKSMSAMMNRRDAVDGNGMTQMMVNAAMQQMISEGRRGNGRMLALSICFI
jgi:hypothetical protein